MVGHLGRYLATLVCVAFFGVVWASSAAALPQSTHVLLVPNAYGAAGHGGDFPLSGFPGGYAPSFTTGGLSLIQNGQLAGYDTVVLVQECSIGTNLADATFKSNLESFVANGGKLIIWDSECQNTNYSNFVYPFTTNNPGAAGAYGTLTDVEASALSDPNPASASYVNTAAVGSHTDAVGDANVMTSQDPHWYVDLTATNTNNVTGPVQTYARYGSGIIIYNGLDMDVIGSGFDPATSSGQDQLARIWLLDLQLGWNPDTLPSAVKVFGLSITPNPATADPGAPVTLTVHASQAALPKAGVVVSFSVTSGPNAGVTGTATTDAGGNATFSYTGSAGGTDTVTASASFGNTAVSDTSTVVWGGGAVYVPSDTITSTYLCWNRDMVNPIAYIDKTADEMWKTGNYVEPQAIIGNVVGGTNIGAYHLVCNAPSTMHITEWGIGGSGEVYDPIALAQYHREHAGTNDLNVYHIWK